MTDVFDFAIKMEQDGEKYYRELAGRASDKGTAAIFTFLADEEVKHCDIFKSLKDGSSPDMRKGTVKAEARNLFEQLATQKQRPDSSSQVALYKKAQELEQKSIDFYIEHAVQFESPAVKELFFKIADEEKLHFLMLDTLIQYVSRPQPGKWLENAEWYHSDEF